MVITLLSIGAPYTVSLLYSRELSWGSFASRSEKKFSPLLLCTAKGGE